MIIDKLTNSDLYISLNPNFAQAFEYLKSINKDSFKIGKTTIQGDYVFAVNDSYQTKDPMSSYLESHKIYIDIQFMVSGYEYVGYSPLSGQPVKEKYDMRRDLVFYKDPPELKFKFNEGMFAIFFPNDLHMPGTYDNQPLDVRKCVVKVKVS